MRALGDALYRLVLFAFPQQFRRHHGETMAAQFRARREALAGQPIALVALWTRAIGDALWHGMSVRRERRLDGSRLSHLPGERFRQDLRFAWRGIIRDRGVTAVVVLTLTLGIAANAVMFGLVDRLLFQAPAGVGHPERVRRVYFGSEQRPAVSERASYPAAAAIRDRVAAFARAAVTFRQPVTIGGGPDAQQALLELANADYFSLLELRPSLGRLFTREEDAIPDGASVVVLAHSFWASRLGGDRAAIGRDIRIEGKPFTIVGVAPRGFSGLTSEPVDLWTPPGALGRDVIGAKWHENFFRYGFELVARLTPGATDQVAAEQATAAYRAAATPEAAAMLDGSRTAFTVPLSGLDDPNGVAPEGKVSVWLFGVAIVVLLISVANVANVLLTRTFGRRREIAVRVAIGISRARLLRQLMTESALLTTMAVAIALVVAYVGGRAIQQVFLPALAADAKSIDLRVLIVTVVLAGLTSLGVGLAPVWYALTNDLSDSLRASSWGTARGGGRLRTALLITQVALSIVLLVGAGLFVRSLLAVRGHDVGIDLDRVVLARLSDRASVSNADAEALHARAVERLRGLDGVESVSISRGSSPMGFGTASTVLREGETLSDIKGRGMPGINVVGPEFFATVGATIERGRGLTDEDVKTSALVVVVNRAMADEKPGPDPLGQCLRLGGPGSECTRIVGIVENVLSHSRVNTGYAQIYVAPTHPMGEGKRPRGLLVRTKGAAANLIPAIRQAVQSLTPDMPFVPVATLETLVAPQLKPWRLGTTMFLIFGGIALVIAVVGLYSAMAFAVSQRTLEIAIRLALGAPRRHVARQVTARGLAAIGAGLVLGFGLALFATRWLVDLLYETSPRDPVVFAAVIAVLAIAATAAAIVPIRRSTAVDPIVILKAE